MDSFMSETFTINERTSKCISYNYLALSIGGAIIIFTHLRCIVLILVLISLFYRLHVYTTKLIHSNWTLYTKMYSKDIWWPVRLTTKPMISLWQSFGFFDYAECWSLILTRPTIKSITSHWFIQFKSIEIANHLKVFTQRWHLFRCDPERHSVFHLNNNKFIV